MKGNKNDINDMQKLAETGWQQMHEMLREKGLSAQPVLFSIPSKKGNLWMAIAAFVFLILIFSYPFILNDRVSFSSFSKIKSSNSFSEKNIKQPLLTNEINIQKNQSSFCFLSAKTIIAG